MQPHLVPAGSIFGWRGPVHSCCGTLMFLLHLVPEGVAGDTIQGPCRNTWIGLPPTIQVQGRQTVVLSGSSGPEPFSQLLNSSCPTFFMWSFLVWKLFTWLSVVLGRIALYRVVYSLCSWEAASSVSYAAILDSPQNVTFFLSEIL